MGSLKQADSSSIGDLWEGFDLLGRISSWVQCGSGCLWIQSQCGGHDCVFSALCCHSWLCFCAKLCLSEEPLNEKLQSLYEHIVDVELLDQTRSICSSGKQDVMICQVFLLLFYFIFIQITVPSMDFASA